MSGQQDEALVTNGLAGAMKMLAPRWRMLAFAVVSICLFTGASLAKPLVIQYALDHGVAEKDSDNLARAGIAFFLLILVVYAFQAVATPTP